MATNKRVASRQHRWLSSVEITGVVLSEPVLADAGNFRSLDKAEIAAFKKQREIWNLPKGMVEGNGQPAWINFILGEFLGLKDNDYWQVGASIPADKVVNLYEQQEVLRPSRVLLDEGDAVMLVLEVPREQSLDRPWLQEKGRWKASPTTKFERLLRETGVEVGLLTNGEAWRLVVASPSETTSWMTWTAQTWNDDPLTFAAFKDLLGESRFFAGPRNQVILELIKQSRQRQLDVADQLGNQVREALQTLVHELDRIDAELDGNYLQGYNEAEVFESSVAFIMRLLFTLYAEENGLLPHGNVTYDRAYGVLHLLTELEETKRLAPEKLKYSYAAYSRLLAGSRLLHDGSVDPDIRIAAHGGQLFDPNRYPLLDGRAKNGEWPTKVPEPPKVRDTVIRDILRSLKYAKADGVRQLVSYRTLAVEQIGHMYEGLLDRRVARAPANKTLLMLQGGSTIKEPEPIDAEEFVGLDQKALIKAIAKHTSKTPGTIKKVLERDAERHTLPYLGTDDAELLEQAKPIERFLLPLGIVRPGGLYVTHGQDRRSSGAHYTPPTLTEPVVRRTLEHQVYVNAEGKPGLLVEPRLVKTPQELLSLKVCDPAMGSGAFLVQATRYLAERLVDAWERMAAEQPDSILTMPFAAPSQGDTSENLMPESREERLVFARRYVAERCIYGVDMNRLAVEMAKLSLWLTTLSTDRPFTFVDHALKHGNSLVGLSPEQIRNVTWKLTDSFGALFSHHADKEVSEAEEHREAIHSIPDHDFVAKENENRIAEEALNGMRLTAALAIAAFFDGANTKQREINLIQYRHWLERFDKDETASIEVEQVVKGLTTGDKPIIPFCWEVEFPEVFHRNNGGFDAFVGNPPFAGKNTIIEGNREYFVDWLKLIHAESHGNSDLVAHFFRRAFNLLRKRGSFGLIATKTIRQGDTRSTGLRWIVSHGGVIYSAHRRVPWPGKAAVIVSFVHLAKGEFCGNKLIDNFETRKITAYLVEHGDSNDPYTLKENEGIAYIGYGIYGAGFTFDDKNKKANGLAKLEELKIQAPDSIEHIYPYLGGEDFTSRPDQSPSRHVINFGLMDLEQASQHPKLLEIVKEKVYPEREALPPKNSTNKKRSKYWWQFGAFPTELDKKRKSLSRFLFHPNLFRNLVFGFVPNCTIPAAPHVAILIEEYSGLAVLMSRFHETWVNFFASSFKDDLRYAPSDCFETFPFPKNWRNNEALNSVGEEYYILQTQIMMNNSIGLTELYNRFNNPSINTKEISSLRELRLKIDKTVCELYELDIENLDADFFLEDTKKQDNYRLRWRDELRDMILGHLIDMNKSRYRKETL